MNNEHITDEQILRASEPFVEFQRADVTGYQRIAFGRAILALRPAAQPASAPAAEPICPACNGSGEGAVLSGGGPDAYDVACVCQTCNGHGLVGGHMADGSGYGEGCPDCNPEPAAQPEVIIATTPEKPVPIGPRMTWFGDTVTAAQPAPKPEGAK